MYHKDIRAERKRILELRFKRVVAIIQKETISDAIDELNSIRNIAKELKFADLLDIIDRQLVSCKRLKIKYFLLESRKRFSRLCVREICEKTNVDDEHLVSLMIFELIKKKKIEAEYFASTNSIIFDLSVNKNTMFYVYKKHHNKSKTKKKCYVCRKATDTEVRICPYCGSDFNIKKQQKYKTYI